ncbi:cytochrome P450 [Streptomyces diastatochromogenes]|uniref:Cytochrome n=1 Tax=Streptomyces diastatochromogenes TaxID=42236 RepID=A0A233RW04_STRDA|nr:cytochrome P450 [Streptomyces diastatochromogenes]MCZ0991394.1 cytochrome P450 [Streptomyces diastatochromogenes]OXY87549.1 cytochrome [Streptomyces diastatochromogenes]
MEIAITPPTDRRFAVSLFSRLRTAKGQANPFPIYGELRSRGGVVAAPWGGHLVTAFDLCDQVLRSRDWLEPDARWREQQGDGTRWTAPSSREMSRTLPALNPPDHTWVRRSAGMFDRASLEQLSGTVGHITTRLLDSLAERLHEGEADFNALVGEELPVATIGHWLGLPTADFPRLRDLTHDQVFTQELLPSASQLAKSDAATAELRTYFTDLVRERRARPGDDPVSRWITVWDDMESDRDKADEAVYYLALFVLLAALETTSTLLSTMTLLLLEHPRQWDWLTVHPELVPAAVEESLRYDPPTHVISRVSSRDGVLGGVEVRKDEMVHLMVGAANRDPAKHEDPELFNLHRKPAHLAFSGGIHYCLGAPLARMEAQTLLHQLVRRFPRLTLVRRPSWAPRVAFRRLLNLDVALS